VIPLLSTVLSLVATSIGFCESVTITAARDGTLYQDVAGSLANGAGDYLFAGRTGQPNSLSRRRAVLRFNLGGQIPPFATITDVRFTLNMSRTETASSTVLAHRVLADWGEGDSDAPGEEGTGAPSEMNDATWVHTFYDTAIWLVPGGDYEPVASASRTVVGLGAYTWGSTSALVADVQEWVDDPATNHGWILIGPELLGGTAKRFDSREHPTPGNRPTLRVEFAPPVPAASTWGLVTLALLTTCAGSVRLRRVFRHVR